MIRIAPREGLAVADDRQRIEIDPRRILPVDRDFGLAGLCLNFVADRTTARGRARPREGGDLGQITSA